jgi:hypothetical protein
VLSEVCVEITELTTYNWQEQRESSSHLVEERRHFRWAKPWSEQARFNVPSNVVVQHAAFGMTNATLYRKTATL